MLGIRLLHLPHRKSSDSTSAVRQRLTSLPPAGQNRTFSYHASRSTSDFNLGREALPNKPPLRRLPSRIQRLRRHFGWLLALVLFVGAASYEMQLSTRPVVLSTVQASDAPYLQSSQTYAQAASELFNASAANRNKLTVNTTQISRRMLAKFPELQDVVISLPLIGDRPTMYIKPASAALVLSTASGRYILDDSGRAVSTANGGSGVAHLRLPVVSDKSGLQVRISQQILPHSTVLFIATVRQQLAAQKLTISSMALPAQASELDVYLEGRPYFAKFNLHDAAADAAVLQSGTLAAVTHKLTKQGITPAEYIDVRLEGRAYYK
jgi:hypothetical protein